MGNLSYSDKSLRTHFELQQIPKKLDELKAEVNKAVTLWASWKVGPGGER